MRRVFCNSLIFLSIFQISCVSGVLKTKTPLDLTKPIRLQLVPELNHTEVTQYHSRAINRIYKSGVLQKKDADDLDFKVQTTIKKIEPMQNRFHVALESKDKSGDGDLHEFAIPEINEKLTLILNRYGEVLDSGEYPSTSIFSLPTVSLPKEAVKIGDSWKLDAKWVTDKQKIPLKIELVSIFKEVRPCEQDDCALIELSGEVQINGPKPEGLDLHSEMRGYLLFSIDKGTVLWSHLRSDQEFQVGDIVNRFKSCLVSYLVEPKYKSISMKVNPYCQSEAELSTDVIP